MEIDSSFLMCLGILREVLPNAVPASLRCGAGSMLEVATSAGCKMASKSHGTVLAWKCVYYNAAHPRILVYTQCTNEQPGDYALDRIVFVLFTFASICMCLCRSP